MRKITIAILSIALSSCQSNPPTERSTEVTTIYQPPLTSGGSGRIIRLDRPSTDLECGEISPSYQYIYGIPNESPLLDIDVVDLPDPSTLSQAEKEALRPLNNSQNLMTALPLMDRSWTRSEMYLRGIKEFTYKRFSLSEAECWALKGDQVAHFLLGEEYKRRRNLEKSATPDGRKASFINSANFKLSIAHYLLAARTPDKVDDCLDDVGSCESTLLRPFPTGAPMAHYLLWLSARSMTPEQRKRLKLLDPEVHLENAARSGVAPAIHAYYQVHRRPEHP